ncbi:MAG TPA: hypothetical protein VGF95_00430 [Solirubrobacteraceae bacterium]
MEAGAHPVTITDSLPEGLVATAISATSGPYESESEYGEVTCTLASLSCAYAEALPDYQRITVVIAVKVEADATSGENEMKISGGGAPSLTVKHAIDVGAEPTVFGVEQFAMTPEEEGGGVDTQAGSHPFQLTTTVAFNRVQGQFNQPPTLAGVYAMPKDLHFDLPAGMIGNPTPFPQCPDAAFIERAPPYKISNGCPPDTVIGVSLVTLKSPNGEYTTLPDPLFNLQPSHGEPARFGFPVLGNPVILDTELERDGEYRVRVNVNDITQLYPFIEAHTIFWGVPGDQRHEDARGWGCLYGTFLEPCGGEQEAKPAPLLTMPTTCGQPFEPTLTADSWAEPGVFTPTQGDPLQTPFGEPLQLDGCNRLPFSAAVSLTPDGTAGSTPTGLNVNVHVPQEEGLSSNGLAPASVRNTTVTLPEGLALNPSAADGLGSCSVDQIGLESVATPACPEDAKVGTVSIETPLLPDPLVGAAYLATQDANPFGSLVALYVVAEDAKAGVLIKLAGEVHLSETGQITAVFEDTPQLPFENFKLSFFGGARAPLATPAACGSYATNASIEPWSGTAPANSSSTFAITSGPEGAPCSSPAPFQPEFEAGTTNIQAGEFSELLTTMGHRDGDQALGGLKVTMPPGLMGSLADVTLCPEPQASEGTCGPESLIGHTVVTAGLGDNPAIVKRPGSVYITGPYKGAPYGLTIVNPAEAGPFDLAKGTACDCIIVRAKIEVNPHTAQLTITSDPLPTILQGIPLQLKHVTVQIDRPGFTFNPTSCNKMAIAATLTSPGGASANELVPFQVTDCAALPFTPKFKASTKAHHTRKDGAYLRVSVESSKGQANIGYAKVALPKALPSELKTLQHACTEAQFNANPAGCPAESDVGTAEVNTPVLPVPLKGPAYFVSRGAQWPELIMVLQGYGVTVYLNGETHISNGVTTTTLGSVPDVPFTKFSLTLPEREYSALAANGNLCAKELVMPVRFVGQNGKTVEQSTQVEVEGCSDEMAVASHNVKGKALTLRVYVPAAGRLQVSGKGLAGMTLKSAGRKTVTVRLSEKHAGGLKTKVHLAFTPNEGKSRKRQTKSVTVSFK